MSNGKTPRTTTRAAVALALASAAIAGVAQAQSAPPPSDSLTWNGITLYGIVDIGLQYQTHGAPISDYFPAGTYSSIAKFSDQSVTGLTPSNLSQSRIGLSGNEPLMGDWAGVFRVETWFNPQSGNIADGLKSLTVNNGKPLTSYTTGVDTSVAGQLFSISYLGVSSPTFGTLTFGRQNTPLADGIAKYDPMGGSQAFSVIGVSGTAAGGGDTEDRRLDQSMKYVYQHDFLNIGGLYQFSGSNGSKNTSFQATVGTTFQGFAGNLYYAKKYDAIASNSLSAKQVGELAGLCNPAATIPPTAPQCYSVSNSLSGTISDNTTYGVMAQYKLRPIPLTVYAGWEHISFDNPSNPLPAGQVIEGGYVLAFVNNAAYGNSKILQVYWAGGKYSINPSLDVTLAYYGYHQNAYSTEAAIAGCSTAESAACSGLLNAVSAMVDWRISKRFDVYAGTFWNEVKNGLAAGFLLTSPNAKGVSTTDTAANITTTVGMRFKF